MAGIPTAWRSTFSHPRYTHSSSDMSMPFRRFRSSRARRETSPSKGSTRTVSATSGMIFEARTQQKVEVNGVRPAQLNPALTPVEFLAAAPQFWNSSFPPGMNGSIRKDASSRTQRRISFQESDAVPSSDRTPVHANLAVIEDRNRATVGRYY
jgi:hypothetical protein